MSLLAFRPSSFQAQISSLCSGSTELEWSLGWQWVRVESLTRCFYFIYDFSISEEAIQGRSYAKTLPQRITIIEGGVAHEICPAGQFNERHQSLWKRMVPKGEPCKLRYISRLRVNRTVLAPLISLRYF